MLKNVNFRITALSSVIWRAIFHTFDLLIGTHCHSAHQCVCIKKVVALSCRCVRDKEPGSSIDN